MGRPTDRKRAQRLRAEFARAVRERRLEDALILMGMQEIEEEEEEEEEFEEEEGDIEVVYPDIEFTPIVPGFIAFQKVDPMSIEAKELAFAALVTGVNPTRAFRFLRLLNCHLPSEGEFYKRQKEVCEAVIALAKESMEEARRSMQGASVISFDGSWDHPRHGSNCVLSVFDQGTGKVIDLVVTSRKVEPGSENYCDTPQLMETQALKISVERLKNLPNIVAYVHDNDSRARKVITDSNWGIQEKLDPGHVFKSFERSLATFQGKNANILSGIEESLKKWFKTLVYSDLAPDKKVFQWLNAVNHYRGCHDYCTHEKGKAYHRWQHAESHQHVVTLVKFLSKTRKFLILVDPNFSTQLNENFNRLKVIFAPKYICWGYSFEARVSCAALQVNFKDWIIRLRTRLGLPPLSPENLRHLNIIIKYKNFKVWKKYILLLYY